MLTQKTLTQEHKMRLRWIVALSSLPLLGVLTAFGIVPAPEVQPTNLKTVVEEISLPNLARGDSETATFWRSERVQRGDTLVELLRRLSVEDAAASEYLRGDRGAESFRQLAVGKAVQAETGMEGNLLALRYLSNDGSQIIIEKSASGFTARTLPPQLEERVFVRSGEIKSSLFAATDEIALPDAAASQLAEIFGGDIDFHHDLRKGDKFTVAYEMAYSNGEPVRTGRIRAAEFVNRGKTYRAVYFQKDENHGDYYTPEGKSMHKAFLRSPLEFSRVSSGFSSSRLHPVLGTMRAHKGVDYAAPTGTKVKVTADGVVSFVGKQGGHGNMVSVDHQGRYTTVYGHLSRFADGIRRGQRVGQGDIIGYVGATGLATGPHLHYEFKINGQQRDPLRVALPDGTPVSASQKSAFLETAGSHLQQLAMLRNTSQAGLD
ncbi:MAG: peptidase M23 [Gallionellaceae bacterium]|nr:MAG: peptidase M23 [Gallionellaceae bacterium]